MTNRILRIPIDILLLTFHYIKGTLWLLNYSIKSFLNLPQIDAFPYGCFTVKTDSGHNACLPGKKYGNSLIFKALCPDCKRVDSKGVGTYCLTTLLTKKNYWRPSLFRLFGIGFFLVVFWTCVGFNIYLGLKILLPSHLKLAIRSKLGVIVQERGFEVTQTISDKDRLKSRKFLANANALMASGSFEEAILEFRNAIKFNSLNSSAFFALGECFSKLNRNVEAIDLFQQCVALDTKNWKAYKHLGILYLKQGETKEALKQAELLLKVRPNLADAYLIIGACRHKSGDAIEAVIKPVNRAKFILQDSSKEYQADTYLFAGNLCYLIKDFDTSTYMYGRVLDLEPMNVEARIGLATLFNAKAEFDLAEAELDQILANDPENIKALSGLAEIDVLKGNIQTAIESLERILKMKPENTAIRLRQALLLVATGKSNDAYKKLKQILKQNPKHTEALITLANMYGNKELYDQAVEYAQKVLEADHENIHANLIIIKAYLAQMDYDKAILLIEKIQQIFPKNYDLTLMSAFSHQQLGNDEIAMALFCEATEIKPNLLTPYLNLGGLYYENGQIDLAISSYEKALAISPDHPTASNNLAMLLLKNKRDVERALAIAKHLKERYPGNPYIDDTLGWAYYHMGDHDKAMELLKLAAEKRPNSSSIQYHLAATLFAQGNLNGANTALTNAFNISQDFPGIVEAKKLLTQIRENL